MERKGNFPDCKDDQSACAKAPCEETGNKNDRRKHHHMVPVENTACGAAAVFHKPNSERAPEKNADKVADIKSYRKEKKNSASDDSGKIDHSDCGSEQKPDKAYFQGITVAFFDICQKIFEIADIFYLMGDKILDAEFRRTEGEIFSARKNLEKHVKNPDEPYEMEEGNLIEEIPAEHDVILFRHKKKQSSGNQQNRTAEQKFEFIDFSEF